MDLYITYYIIVPYKNEPSTTREIVSSSLADINAEKFILHWTVLFT